MGATWFTLYGPPTGHGSVGHRVAYTTPVVKALKHHATVIAEQAETNLNASHRRTGGMQIKVIHRHNMSDFPWLDSWVVLHDTNPGDGWEDGNNGSGQDGETSWGGPIGLELGGRRVIRGKVYIIPGAHILGNAIGGA
jgi:hypothetical protein